MKKYRMKKVWSKILLPIILVFCLVSYSYSQSYLLYEDWEGSGVNGWSKIGGGTFDPDNTSPQLERLQNASLNGAVTETKTFSDSSSLDTWFFTIYRTKDTTPLGPYILIYFYDKDNSSHIRIYCWTDGRLRTYSGGYGGLTTTYLQDNTTYYIWVRSRAGTGANGQIDLYISTTPQRPVSPEVQQTNGTSKLNSIKVGITQVSAQTGFPNYFDYILVDDQPIGSADLDTTKYYIDPDYGNDANSGGYIEYPLASFDSINTAGITLDPGFEIYQKTGTTIRQQLTVPSSGTSGSPITFSCYDSAATPLYGSDATGAKPIVDSTGTLIDFNSKDYITLEYLEFRNGLVQLNTGTNNIIRYCEFDSADANALLLDGKTNSIYYNLFMNYVTDAIEVDSSANTIYNNLFWNGVNGIDVDTNVTIRNNTFWSNSGDDINITANATVTGGYNSYQDAARAGTGTYNGTSLWATYPIWTDTTSLDFTLQSTSPCIDAGTSVGLTLDYIGNTVPRNAGVDIGAYEYQLALDKWFGFPKFKKYKIYPPWK